MNPTVFRFSAIASVLLGAMPLALAFHGPFDGRTFQGRIAYSCDGNYNDPDDWGASPVALAIFAECGVKDKVVHFDYNCIFPLTDPAWEETHTKSIMGAADYYGYDKKVLIDCRKDRQVAIDDIARIIDESSADNPLFSLGNIIVAPHALGWTEESAMGIGTSVIESVLAVREGRAPATLANPDVVDSPVFQQKLADLKARNEA